MFRRETFPNDIHSSFIERPTRPSEPLADILRAWIATAVETLSEAIVVRIRFNAKARIFVRRVVDQPSAARAFDVWGLLELCGYLI
jgi:hypothetical protein